MKHFTRAFHQAQTSYFWRVCLFTLSIDNGTWLESSRSSSSFEVSLVNKLSNLLSLVNLSNSSSTLWPSLASKLGNKFFSKEVKLWGCLINYDGGELFTAENASDEIGLLGFTLSWKLEKKLNINSSTKMLLSLIKKTSNQCFYNFCPSFLSFRPRPPPSCQKLHSF